MTGRSGLASGAMLMGLALLASASLTVPLVIVVPPV